MTTTFEAVRDAERVALEALTPQALSEVAFRYHDDVSDFREWSEDNPQSCLRRFVIRDLFQYGESEGSVNGEMPITGAREIVVAYPNEPMYWPDSRRDVRQVVRLDAREIATAVGDRGYASFASSSAYDNHAWTVEIATQTTVLSMIHQFQFWRVEPR